MMDWVTSVLLIVVGGFFTVMNWAVLYVRIVKKERHSWVPVLGGLFLAVGLGTLPIEGPENLWWIPFIADPACVPGMSYTLWFWLFRYKKEEKFVP